MNQALSVTQEIFQFIIILYSIILHEIAHGYAAYIQGDETANRAGRLTLNPLPHIDITGSVIVPLLAFFLHGPILGWAKPVPYNQYNIRTKLGQAFVAAAGVLTNLLLALLAGIVFKVLNASGSLDISIQVALLIIIKINVSLAFFNLTPIPPFDGMSILQALFPRMHIRSSIIYSPVYMIGAIVLASVLYSMLMPHVFGLISQVLL